LGFDQCTVSDVFRVFEEYVTPLNRIIFKDMFVAAYCKLFGFTFNDINRDSGLMDSLDSVYDMFDQNKDGFVDIDELASGLSILCSGNADEKVREAFRWFDENGDGTISKQEMAKYLSSVFTMMAAADPVKQQLIQDPASMAMATTEDAFLFYDQNRDGKLSFEEFTMWYQSQAPAPPKFQDLMEWFDENKDGTISKPEMVKYLISVFTAISADSTEQHLIEDPASMAIATADDAFLLFDLDLDGKLSFEEFTMWYQNQVPAKVTFQTMKERLGTSDLSIHDLKDVLFRVSHQNQHTQALSVDVGSFHSVFVELARGGTGNWTMSDLNQVLRKIFVVLAGSDHAVADFNRLVTGLSILCRDGGLKGSGQNEMDAFNMIDRNGDGVITFSEMTYYMEAVFQVIFAVLPHKQEECGVTALELADATARQAFNDADVNHDGMITVEEFLLWCSTPSHEKEELQLSLLMPGLTEGMCSSVSEFLKQVRATFGLRNVTVAEALGCFEDVNVDDGISKGEFFDCMFDILNLSGAAAESGEELSDYLNSLFEVFDTDGSGTVDPTELKIGLSLLCSGGLFDKLCTIFNIYDQDGDGFISQYEMESYLESAYKLAYANREPAERALMASEKAIEVAQSAFIDADTNDDGLLNFDEFYRWYREGINNVNAAIISATSWQTMAEAKRLTNLVDHDLDDVIEVFAEHADVHGCLTLNAFEAVILCFHQEDAVLDEQDRRQRRLVIERLFHIFDTDENGVVDIVEIISGISVLCDRDQDHQFEIMFRLLDKDAEGFITFQDLEMYLTSLFKVLKEVEPDALGAEYPAETLGYEAAARVFGLAEKNMDEGEMSMEEFKSWAHSTRHPEDPKRTTIEGLSLGEIIQPTNGDPLEEMDEMDDHLTFNDARVLTHLHERNCNEVFEHFKQYADSSSELDKRGFRMAFYHLLTTRLDSGQLHDFNSFVDNLFGHFDSDGSGMVDFRELVAGLSVMCAGTGEDKVRSAFNLYDINGDGFISFSEMKNYLTAVFKVIFEAQPNVRKSMGNIDPGDLGSTTAEQVFAEADVNHDGKISFEEFAKWQNTSSWGGGVKENAEPEAPPASLKFVEKLHEALSYEEVRKITHLDRIDVADFFEVLADNSHDGLLSVDDFKDCFQAMLRSQNTVLDGYEMRSFEQVLERIFTIFDLERSGEVPFTDLASGLSIMCHGEREGKIQTVFQLFDVDGDGFISFVEMVRYLTMVFRVVYETTPGVMDQTGLTAEELACVTAEQAFKEFDLNHDNQLSFEEFKFWYHSPASEGLLGDEKKGPMSPMGSLNRVREMTSLGDHSVEDVIGVFSDHVGDDGSISFPSFVEAFHEFREVGLCSDEDFLNVMKRIFLSFDVNGDGAVDFNELLCGLSILCGGEEEEKIESAFALFDADGNGYVSMPEMCQYLSSVFRVVHQVQPDMDIFQKVGPDDLAAIIAEQAFQENDINQDGVLSLFEFKSWYKGSFLFQEATTSRQSYGEGIDRETFTSKTDDDYHKERISLDDHKERVSLDDIREATNLKSVSTGQLLDMVGRHTDSRGRLTKTSFKAAFASTLRTVDDPRRADDILSRLFDIFDTSKDGFVDHSELACGLSVLCGGAFEEKVETAFQMYDLNGDGFISMDEMVRYLTSVFKVVFETKPYMQEEMGVTAEELGRETAEHAFQTADLNHDGRISYEEFKQWYLTTDDSVAHLDEQIPEWFVLSQVREVCKLSAKSTRETFDAFARETDELGCLSLAQFKRAFVHIGLGANERTDQMDLILNRLFSIFDQDQTGKVDYQELVSGLSVLCGGNREDKIRAAFALFDFNGDGFISLDEMERYLVSVFKMLYATQDGIKEQMGVTAEELGRITAQQAFKDSDLDNDGRLSWDEFKAWYGLGLEEEDEDDSDEHDDSEVESVSDEDGDIHEVEDTFEARVFDESVLPESHIAEIFEAFAERADLEGQLHYEDFISCFQSHFLKSVESELPYEFFSVADNNGFEAVDYCEMMVMLSVFAGGSDEDKAQAVFTLFDFQNQGYINLEEMTQMLLFLYQILFHAFPWAYKEWQEQHANNNPEKMSQLMALQCFSDADVNRAGSLSFEQFLCWFSLSHPHSQITPSRTAVPADLGTGSIGSSREIEEARRLTNLNVFDVQDIFETFDEAATDGMLTWEAFERTFGHIIRLGGGHKDVDDSDGAYTLIANIFDDFSTEEGLVAVNELTAGLSVLCGNSSVEERIVAAFLLFDTDSDGYITFDEMITYMSCIFKMIYNIATENLSDAFGIDAETLAHITAEQCFDEADMESGTEKLNFAEFKEWCTQNLG